jgi:peptide/nickel transport system permease protein
MVAIKNLVQSLQRPNLSSHLMRVGLIITFSFIAIAVFAPLLQGLGWLQDPTELLSNNPQI